jgi:hypothetical protein
MGKKKYGYTVSKTKSTNSRDIHTGNIRCMPKEAKPPIGVIERIFDETVKPAKK